MSIEYERVEFPQSRGGNGNRVWDKPFEAIAAGESIRIPLSGRKAQALRNSIFTAAAGRGLKVSTAIVDDYIYVKLRGES